MKTGDVVIKVSGGPLMTVRRVAASLVECAWSEDGDIREGRFPMEDIEPAETPDVERMTYGRRELT